MFDENQEHTHAQNLFAVIPTAEKKASHEFTSKKITIAFIDSDSIHIRTSLIESSNFTTFRAEKNT